ncbi:MAG: extracellular solute-binding protein [Gemmobacter sp.]|nr:extracellular solute-binding protein [Gemmobacter sp.]
MKKFLMATVAAGAFVASAGLALADCGIAKGSVRILSNDFEALHIVAAGAEKCASGTVTVTKNQTTEHKNIQIPALTANPATYTVAVVANNSIVPLLNGGLIRPLDDLVAKFGQQLNETQLVKIDGKVMAIAFMANTQHMYYRKDLLEQAGIAPPKTYEEVLEAAKVLRDKGILKNPLALNMKPGWDLAQEFVNMYMGYGGDLFKAGTAEASINNENGVKTLEMLKALTGYMSPDYVTYNTNAIKPIWEAGEIAIINGWGSRAGAYIAADSPVPEIAKATAFASAPMVGGGSTPATTLWWDGFTIAKNISDEDAEASFRAMMNGTAPQTAVDHGSAAVWLISGYKPTPAAVGVFETIANKAKPFPMLAHMGLLHTALGDNISEFLQGKESAEQALADATAAYTTAAKENGFLK